MKTLTRSLEGTRFGTIEYLDSDVVTVPEGLVGFPDLCRFLLIAHKEGSPFRWLQSVDEPAIAFLTADPLPYVPSYTVELRDSDAERLQLDSETPALVLATASIPGGDVASMTLNLAAPIVINLSARLAKQVVLDGGFDVRHPAFSMAKAA